MGTRAAKGNIFVVTNVLAGKLVDVASRADTKALTYDLATDKYIHSDVLTTASVTYETLNTNGDVGTGAGQLAIGNHSHTEFAWLDQDVTTAGRPTFYGIDYDTTQPVPSYLKGRVFWHPTDETLTLMTSYPDVMLNMGQEMHLPKYLNNSGSTILNGSVVFINASNEIQLAKADKPLTAERTIGVATHDIPTGTYGIATTFGLVKGLDTSTCSSGAILYLSATTAGAFTETKPEHPNYIIKIGHCGTSHLTDGNILVNVTGSIDDINDNGWNGNFTESFDFLITSDGTTVTGSLSNPLSNQLTMHFSDGFTLLDTTTPVTIPLTPGTDTDPQEQFVYIPKSTKNLTVSTAGFPTTEQHIRIASVVLQSAATTQTNKALKNQNINNHTADVYGQGHIHHLADRLRTLPAEYESGVDLSVTIQTVTDPDNVYVSTSAGKVYQLHLQDFPAQSMPTDDINIVNHPTTPYATTSNLNTQLTDASGVSMSGTYYSLVIWGVCNKSGEVSHLMCNLPTGSYGSSADAIADPLNKSVYTIPKSFKGTGFLIARVTLRHQVISSGTWTLIQNKSLLGFIPNSTAGGSGAGSSGITTYSGLTDTPNSMLGQALKLVRVAAGETAHEYVATSTINLSSFNDNLDVTERAQDAVGTILSNEFTYNDVTPSIALNYANISHTALQNIGTNTHVQLDSHLADSTIHYTQGAISIPASQVSDFDVEVANNTDVAANTLARHAAVTIADSSTVDLTLTGQQISASVIQSGISHLNIADKGVNTHAQIDTHLSDATIHYAQSAISIPSSQLTDGSNLVTLNGTQTITGIKTFTNNINVESAGTEGAYVRLNTNLNTTAHSIFEMITKNDGFNLANNTEIGAIKWSGHDALGYVSHGSYIQSYTTEDWTSTDHGMNMIFATTKNGDELGSTRMYFESDGRLRVVDGLQVNNSLYLNGLSANIGLGTLTPDKRLTLEKDKAIGWKYGDDTTNSFHHITAGQLNPMKFTVNPTGSDISVYEFLGTSTTPIVKVMNGGRVGINTTPTYTFQVKRSGVNGVGGAGVFAIESDAKTVNDAIVIANIALDDLDNSQEYSSFRTTILSPTSGSESSEVRFYTQKNGTNTLQATVGGVNAITANGNLSATAGTFSGDVTVADESYGVSWNGSTEVPTKNAVYDKIETISTGSSLWTDFTTYIQANNNRDVHVGNATNALTLINYDATESGTSIIGTDYDGTPSTWIKMDAVTGEMNLYGTVTASSTVTATNFIGQAAQTITYSATPTHNWSSGNNATITLTGDVTTYTLSNVPDGGTGDIRILQNATGGYGIAAVAHTGLTVDYIDGLAPTAANINSAANGVTYMSYKRVGSYLAISYASF